MKRLTTAAAAIALLITLTGCGTSIPTEHEMTVDHKLQSNEAQPGTLIEQKSGSAGIISDDAHEQGILIETRSGSAGIGAEQHRP
ncbi:hypothetical protein [Microbacterium sp. p3-SID336]|uniref:hypothetical protein n=1 Tax=Microbacterium sp. p3-SID336 TaxID=2916212 RepID=UPI0021A2A98F|nr:hypothetical protein [Microbacterium sp. p3-SID336]MCT1478687.1 hypothetical protein [Microbacterium sp. p3-SID336]